MSYEFRKILQGVEFLVKVLVEFTAAKILLGELEFHIEKNLGVFKKLRQVKFGIFWLV